MFTRKAVNCWVFSIIGLTASFEAQALQPLSVSIDLQIDKSRYFLGEPVQLLATVHNIDRLKPCGYVAWESIGRASSLKVEIRDSGGEWRWYVPASGIGGGGLYEREITPGDQVQVNILLFRNALPVRTSRIPNHEIPRLYAFEAAGVYEVRLVLDETGGCTPVVVSNAVNVIVSDGGSDDNRMWEVLSEYPDLGWWLATGMWPYETSQERTERALKRFDETTASIHDPHTRAWFGDRRLKGKKHGWMPSFGPESELQPNR